MLKKLSCIISRCENKILDLEKLKFNINITSVLNQMEIIISHRKNKF